MKYRLVLVFAALCSANVLALGQTGHRVTGSIAEKYLTEETKIAIKKIIGNQSLAEASNYADEMRSDPSEFWQKQASHYHYVTVPKGKSYTDVGAPEEGDAMFALNKFAKVVRNPSSSKDNKSMALKFIIHLIGDLHQPFHVGNGTDRGGNDIKVTFFGKKTNLHRVWDNDMINQKKLSYTEWSDWLNRQITKQDLKKWSVTDPLVWIKESAKIRDAVYPKSDDLKYEYAYQNLPIIKQRLKQAGVRIAAYLNELLKDNK